MVLVVAECSGWLPGIPGFPRTLGVNSGDPLAMLLLGLSVGVFLGLGLFQVQRMWMREFPSKSGVEIPADNAWSENFFQAGELDDVSPDLYADSQTMEDAARETVEPWERPADWWRQD